MSRTYAITIQQSSGAINVANYNRVLNRIEIALNVEINHRCFETGGLAKRLHVHATITTPPSLGPVLTHSAVEKILQKNQRKNFVLKEIFDPIGWKRYIEKDQEPESDPDPLPKCYCYPSFDVRKFTCGILRKV